MIQLPARKGPIRGGFNARKESIISLDMYLQAGDGGSLAFNKSLHLNLNTCLWWLATNSRKQIVLNISVGPTVIL